MTAIGPPFELLNRLHNGEHGNRMSHPDLERVRVFVNDRRVTPLGFYVPTEDGGRREVGIEEWMAWKPATPPATPTDPEIKP